MAKGTAARDVAREHGSCHLVPGTDGGDVGQGKEDKHREDLELGCISQSILGQRRDVDCIRA